MNAYELADKLDWHWDNDCRSPAVSKSADMLRQQADRIAELEKQLAFMEGEYPEPTIVQKMQEFANLEQALKKIVKYEEVLHSIANDYHELSDHKIEVQIRKHKKWASDALSDTQLHPISLSGNNAQNVGNINETLPKGK